MVMPADEGLMVVSLHLPPPSPPEWSIIGAAACPSPIKEIGEGGWEQRLYALHIIWFIEDVLNV